MDTPRLSRPPLANCAFVALIALASTTTGFAASSDEARITKIIRDVKLLPTGAKAKPATLNAEVNADTGVRTGDRSRSELTFVDLTIERMGANTVFHFSNAGRTVELDGGSMLLRIPKNSGGAQMQTGAVTVGVTGTTLILETTSGGRNKLIVLEGNARLSLRRHPRESVNVRGGQMEDVPAGATKLPPPVNINLNDVMNHHPLITDFPPLPSQDLIYATAHDQPVQGQPVGPGAAVIPPVIGGILGGPIAIGGGGVSVGGGGSGGGRHGVKTPKKPPSNFSGNDGVSTGTTGTPGRGRSPAPKPNRKKPKTG